MKNTKVLNLTFKFSPKTVAFLDTMLCKDENNLISKQVYIENLQMDKHSYTINQNTQNL